MGSGQDLPHGWCNICGRRDDVSFDDCGRYPCPLKDNNVFHAHAQTVADDERKKYGTQIGPGNYTKVLDNSYEQTKQQERDGNFIAQPAGQRTIGAKIERLRTRLKQLGLGSAGRDISPILNVLLGILDLLEDEL